MPINTKEKKIIPAPHVILKRFKPQPIQSAKQSDTSGSPVRTEPPFPKPINSPKAVLPKPAWDASCRKNSLDQGMIVSYRHDVPSDQKQPTPRKPPLSRLNLNEISANVRPALPTESWTPKRPWLPNSTVIPHTAQFFLSSKRVSPRKAEADLTETTGSPRHECSGN